MRSSEYGIIPDLILSYNKKDSLEIFRKMCLTRYFELGLIEAIKEGRVTYPIYLSLGQEAVAAALSSIIRNYQIFTQHRCHATYLSFGGSPEKLRDELLGLSSGTSRGRAGSNCIQCHENNVSMYGHHGLIGENVPLAVGAALGNNKQTVCFFGDGAAEEDYVISAMGFAITHKLPVLFICEDNNLSILTPIKVRRSWNITDLAKALGMPAIDITDDPWTIIYYTRDIILNLPAFINIYVCRSCWHSGIGTDGAQEWNRFELVKDKLNKLGLSRDMQSIEDDIYKDMQKLWRKKEMIGKNRND